MKEKNMGTSNVGIVVPDKLIEDLVYAEIARSISQQPDMIEKAVEQMLRHKQNSYDRETVFQSTVRNMVGEVAKECMKKWVEQNREKLEAEFQRVLARKGTAAKLAKNIVESISAFDVRLSWTMRDE